MTRSGKSRFFKVLKIDFFKIGNKALGFSESGKASFSTQKLALGLQFGKKDTRVRKCKGQRDFRKIRGQKHAREKGRGRPKKGLVSSPFYIFYI